MTDYRFEYIKNQMTDELLVEQQKTNDETIQTLKEDIAILQEKLQKLEELQRTKSPVEEAYKKVYGAYPPTTPSVSNFEDTRWSVFQAGYNASKVSETPQEPEELKTLYDVLRELDKPMFTDDVCSAVKNWMSQYADNVMCGEYKKGYEECLTVLEENLKND
jgi:hypothetical protein